ncbi:hypothetical protein HMPREF0290_2867 [Corynebacterium efficiens YS-314]|nr:hypothetical protein HMPREF0290_2867 [Corynebacterium efficiens YS-314]
MRTVTGNGHRFRVPGGVLVDACGPDYSLRARLLRSLTLA